MTGDRERVNEHFFVGGIRVASSASTWTAPSAASLPGFAWRGPELPLPTGWALGAFGALGVGLLFGLALRARKDGAPLAVRVTAAGLLVTAMPALIASDCTPTTNTTVILGTHGVVVIFYGTDHLGSTVVAARGDRTLQTRRG